MFNKNFRDYFIPHADNNYAPHSLQKAAMVAMLFLIVLSFTLTNALSLIWISSQWMVGAVLPAVIVELTNDERQVESLGTLKRSSVLDTAAKLKAQDMAKNEYFAHYSPKGISPWFWFGEAKYNFVHAGENLAIHFTDSSDVVTAWMDSPTHKANIMNGNYTEIGVGTAEGTYEGFKTIYVVQLFGTPAAPTVASVALPSVAGETITQEEVTETNENKVLSESVTLNETVEVIEADENPQTSDEVVMSEVVGSSTSEVPVGTKDVSEVAIVESEPVVPTKETIVYSDFMSTSTGGIAALTGDAGGQIAQTTPFILKIATQPHVVLQTLYILIGLFVFVCLLLSIFIEIRYQQPVQIAYGIGLLTLMSALFYIHTSLITGAFIL